MKKIKPNLKKTKISGKPHIGIFLHAHLRHKLVDLTAAWYRELTSQLSDQVKLSLFLSAIPDQTLDQIAQQHDFTRITVTAGQNLGIQLNEGLGQLNSKSLDAVIPVAPGDFLMSSLIQAHAQHLHSGGLLGGLLDQYFYDPAEFKCIYWARGEVKSGLDRACDIGLMISSHLLDHLKWQLWPSQSTRKFDHLQQAVMERIGQLLDYAPPKTCLLQSMAAYNGQAFTLKSELGRALFDEGNWLQHLAQTDVDFENIFLEHMGEEWVSRIDQFDERIKLDILVEAPHSSMAQFNLWRDYYTFLPYKFEPYAQVRLRLIPHQDESESEANDWSDVWEKVEVDSKQKRGERWNQAVQIALKEGAELLLMGGIGSLVDLKTIEHYLIFATQQGVKLQSVSNFFIAFEEQRQGYFWPGKSDLAFQRALGFGSCIHRDYLTQFDPNIFDDQGRLTETVQKQFDDTLIDSLTKHQRLLYQLIRHELGLIAFEIEGAFGFSDLIQMSDLKAVNISEHLHSSSYLIQQKEQLNRWEQGLRVKQHQSTSQVSPLLSPLSSSSMELPSMSSNQSTSSMSALERAKALLKQSKENVENTISTAVPEVAEAIQETVQAPMSALERAKALLKANASSTAQPANEPEPTSPEGSNNPLPQESKPMSALERAKLLLQQAQQPVESTAKSTEVTPDPTQALLQQAMRGAEAMIGQLQATADAAKSMVNQEKEQLNTLAKEVGAESPANLLCERGELAFEQADEAQAKTLFESALVVDPGCIRALNNLGVMALQSEEPWKALSHFLMGALQDPQHEDILINMRGLFDLYPELKNMQTVIFDS